MPALFRKETEEWIWGKGGGGGELGRMEGGETVVGMFDERKNNN